MPAAKEPTALVTGSTSGIGAAFADRLAAHGHDLVLVARSVDRLDQQAADLRHRYGGQVQVLPADLSEPEQLRRVEHRLTDASRPVALLVNNAGFGLNTAFARTDITSEERQLDVLVRAVLRLTHAAIGPMVSRGSGAVINVSSVAGWITGGTYNAAKAWVTSFSAGLAAELAGTGVSVQALCPGLVRTNFHQAGSMDVTAIPPWLWLTPEQVAAAALRDVDRGRALSVPTTRYQVLSTLARYAPATLVAAVYRRGRPRTR